jgi:hypothetical protein
LTTENDLDLIHSAIQAELAKNPDCPMVSDLYALLLIKIGEGDKKALDLALRMAHASLAPKKSIFSFLKRTR